ncbi:YwqG family protein [Phycicoccus avicenniae]|uniref:YwqG family protein n=1 Tax=Phycicoccus avicenniae TaxID=2828860 RepID=UPI003D2C1155
MSEREDLRSRLEAAGLSAEGVAAVLDRVRPAVVLEPAEHPPSGSGASRLGGSPDLPPDLAWPERPAFEDGAATAAAYLAANEDPTQWWRRLDAAQQERIAEDHRVRAHRVAGTAPLSFVAQVDLAQVAATGETHPELPTTGRLLFFYDLLEMPWGFAPGDAVGSRVLHDDTDVGALVRRDPPADLVALGSEGVLPEVVLRPRATLTAPPPGAGVLEGLLPDHDAEAYHEWSMTAMDEPGWDTHQVGGWPHQVQGDMQLECALVSAGHSTGDGRAFEDPVVRAAAEEEAPEWVLVLQVASDDDRGFMWGDSGFLYVWMRRKDLRERAFERAHLVLQCF